MTIPYYMQYQFCVLILAIILSSCNNKSEKIAKKTKPNIVFIFTDDQANTSIHALGNKEIITPNIDKLVEAGTTFTHAYNMGSWSGAVCTASRTMLNSGRSVWRANNFRKHWTENDSLNKTWSKILENQGYETYMTGKWHVDAKADKIFNHTKHIRPGMPKDAWNHYKMIAKFDSLAQVKNRNSASIMPNGYNRPLSVSDTSWSPTDSSKGGFWDGGKHWSEVLADDAISFIDTAKNTDKPFFMYLAFNAPHDPRQAPQEYQDLYNLDELTLPNNYMPEYTFRNDIGNGDNLRDEALAPFPRTELAIKTHTKEYYASITHVDAQIGGILEALKSSGKMDNTYIFFSADHGLAMGQHGLLGKQSLFDHSIRPPLIILGPDIPKNKKNNADVYLQDIMATTLDLAGIDKPKYIEFSTFLDLAKAQSNQSKYDAIYGAYLDVQRMIRKDNYKLLVFPKIKKVLLFDLNTDPEEIHDIANLSGERNRVISLFKDLQQLQKQMEDPLDISDCFPSH
ncbi:choline sulfatase [Formosa agariphila KMM 3901]|uniref:Choline sulfatase n=1 Tax=Formosa agariphila (strain DSM 15362 / KCTC 12365 / LMG 23005 / KMM 3901 / M-2Alg 35-1) TaxID=1347342 RepID=T2KMX8_FORAG|nr:sulfatase-like hydrolase/transferase [Formosa agariphila]CDF79798.1 choline sulfatase [Formosa agariphila KMM 3901]